MTDRLQNNPLAVPLVDNAAKPSLENGNGLVAAHSKSHVSEQNGPIVLAFPGALDEVQAAIERGRTLLASGDYDLAASELTQAIRLAPENPDSYLLRGQVSEQQGDDDRALDDYSFAVQLDVSQLLTFAQRLLAFAAKRDFASAVADADQSLLVNQRLCRACFLRSAIYNRRSEWAKAVSDYNQILQLEPANSVAYLRRGDVNARLSEWAKAVADYTESLRLDPQSIEAFNNRGEALLRLGQADQALADFTAALRLDPHFAVARTNRADAHMRRGEYDQAITDYNQAIHLMPGSPRPYTGRALARIEKGDWERALGDLNKAQTLDPATAHSPEGQRATERLRSAYDQAIAGLNQFKRLFRQVSESIGTNRIDQLLPEISQSSPTADSHSEPTEVREPPPIAPAIQQTARPQKSNEQTRAIQVQQPASTEAITPLSGSSESQSRKDSGLPEEDQTGRHQKLAARHCRKGQVFQKEGDRDRAVAAYTAALAVDPTCVEAYAERGLINRLARRLDEALEDFNTAIELEPSAELHFRRGVAYAEQREYKLAFADFDEALRLDPDHALTYLNRGLILVIAGKFERAAEDAERALAIDPMLTRARFLRGVALGKMGRHDLAAGDIDAVLVQEPENARAHNHRGLAYAAEQNFDEAIAAYDEAIRLTPDLWAAYFNRGIAYHLKGDFDGAVNAFTQFTERRPQYAPAHHQRGLAHLAREEYDAAIADFTQAFQLDPNLTEAYTSCMEATRLKYESKRESSVHALARAREMRNSELRTLSRIDEASAKKPSSVEYGLPPGFGRDEPNKEALSGTITAKAERTVLETPKLPTPPSGKLQLECPECGTSGLLDLKHLGKKFRCPGCHAWWRTNAGGNLEETTAPEKGSSSSEEPKSGIWKAPTLPATDTGSKSGIWKPVTTKPVQAATEGSAAAEAEALLSPSASVKSATDATPTSRTATKPAPTSSKGAPKVVRRQKVGSLRYAGLWLAAFAQTKAALWTAVGGILLFCFAIPFLFPGLFPSELRSRGQKVAQAWLARDAEQIRPFADPTQAENVARWLEATPPPELNDGKGKPEVNVNVERNDGDTAEILIQIKADKANGIPAYYVYRHRWILRKDTWYLQPDIPAAGTSNAGKGGQK